MYPARIMTEPLTMKAESELRNALATVAALRAELLRVEAQLKHACAPIWPDPWEDGPTAIETATERDPPFPPQYRPHEEQPQP